jgi:hypothetical protein
VRELARRRPGHLYEGLLTVLMRLVFVLYAEDRGLLPSRSDGRAQKLYETGYRTEPPLPDELFLPEESEETAEDGKQKKERPFVEWVRVPRVQTVRLPVPDGRGKEVVVPDSAAVQRRGGGLMLEAHARLFTISTPHGDEEVRALTVFLVNRRTRVHRFYGDVSFVFQARLELTCPQGFTARRDISSYTSGDFDQRVADLHYRDVCEYAVGRNAAASWDAAEEQAGRVSKVWTDPLPQAEVDRVAPNEDETLKQRIVFGMEALADRAATGGPMLAEALTDLPVLSGEWIKAERSKFAGLAPRRREAAEQLVADMEKARQRIRAGLDILSTNDLARRAFRYMNLAVARAARRRNAGAKGDPAAQPPPEWRPFQLAFILLNLAGLADRKHSDREIADLLFFPTGGGKTEAYLGLAAFVIAYRRLTGPGVLGAGVAVIMRYTLRLLTLDQLARAAGVVCALELMRTDPNNVDKKGRRSWKLGLSRSASGSARMLRPIA